MAQSSFILNTGASIPAIALGTWGGMTAEERKVEVVAPWILSALKAGYRHLDTAYSYGIEMGVGEAIRQSGIPRKDLFITTKLLYLAPCAQGRRVDRPEPPESGTDYVDLYLLHWPQVAKFVSDEEWYPKDPQGDLEVVDTPTFNEVWAELEKVLASGKAKAIGVSNFSIKNLEKLLTTAKIVPAVNQVELHPALAQTELFEYCKAKGILLAAYTPSGYANIRNHPLVAALAQKYHSTPNQITLGWHLERGNVLIPGSKNAERQKENLAPVVGLEAEDVARITALDSGTRFCNKPNESGKVFGWTLEQLGW